MAMLLVHHNTFFNLCDHLTKLILKNSKEMKLAKFLHVEKQKQPL